MAARRVCVQPCLGINIPEATVGRQASYLAHEMLLGPECSDLGCSPALYADVQEDVDFILEDLVIAVESCERACATKLVRDKGGEVHATIRVQEVLAEEGIDAAGLPREHLELDHPAVAAVARRIAIEAERLLGSE
ncbi:MAG: putative zinc-binding protein [Armatimonadota bacterium]|nr:putative zinc-binding protein [Armatimonadota bacterium]